MLMKLMFINEHLKSSCLNCPEEGTTGLSPMHPLFGGFTVIIVVYWRGIIQYVEYIS